MKLYKDNEGRNTIDFSGEITFSKADYGIENDLKFDAGLIFIGKRDHFVSHKKTKIARFIYAAKILWRWV